MKMNNFFPAIYIMPNKFKNTIKAYAKKYDISVVDDNKFKSVNRLSNEIYDYEKKNRPAKPMYPFLDIKGKFLLG